MILHYKGFNEIGEIVDIAINIHVDDNSYRLRAIKGDHCLTLHYALDECIDLPLGTWCEFEGIRYELYDISKFTKKGVYHFEYTVILETDAAKLRKWKVRNKVDSRLKFELTAKPREHLQLIVDNLNMRDIGWSVGYCIDTVEKCIAYNHIYCRDALTQQSEEFDTEYEIIGKTLNLGKLEYNFDNPLNLSYGEGLKSGVGRVNLEDGRPIEILLVQGGTDNIDFSTYGSHELRLPKSQKLVYEDRTYITDELGLSIMRDDKALTSQEEDSLDLSHISPSWEHVVTAVESSESHKWDVIDINSPESLDYRDCRIEGETANIIFQSGMLSGKTFEIMQTKAALTGYIHAERRFKLVSQDIDGQSMPNDIFKPKIGDKFKVFGVKLPSTYISDNATKTGAEWEMFKEGVKQLYECEGNRFSVTGELDGIWSKKDWLNIGGKIALGGYVNFSDPQFLPEGEKIRITAIKDYINNPHSPKLTLSNSPISGSVSTELDKIKNNEVIVDNQHKESLQFTKRRFRDSIETMKMLEAAMLNNFSSSISPIAVHTMMMLAGDEALQFEYYDSSRHLEVVYSDETKILICPQGTIKHLTLGIKNISSSHKESEYKKWSMTVFNSPPLAEKDKSYYLYAKVSKTTNTGEFRLSETAVGMNDVADCYHLWVGTVGSEYDGARSYASMYGYTEIAPGRITTDKIVSANGLNYMDLLNGIFNLGGNRSGLSFNENNDSILRLKGTMIQSPGSDEDYAMGVFRGDYSNAVLYYIGDEVYYNKSTYRCIWDCPTAGIMPHNATYWKVVAAKGTNGNDGDDGNDGKDGKGIEFIFKRQNTVTAPSTPSASQTDDHVPSGWTDDQQGVTSSLKFEFVSKRIKVGGVWSAFSKPSLWAKYSFDGANGSDGTNGNDGTNGTDGNDGANGNDGTNGADGEAGAMMRPRGIWDAAKTYVNNAEYRDVVLYSVNDEIIHYIVSKRITSVATIPPTSTDHWTPANEMDFVAIKALTVDDAFINNMTVKKLQTDSGKVVITEDVVKVEGEVVATSLVTSGSFVTKFKDLYISPGSNTTILDAKGDCYFSLRSAGGFFVKLENNSKQKGYNCAIYNESTHTCVVNSTHPDAAIYLLCALGPGELVELVNIGDSWIIKKHVKRDNPEYFNDGIVVNEGVVMKGLPRGTTDSLSSADYKTGTIMVDTGQNSRGWAMLRVKI